METNDRIAHLESDIKILKNEVQAVLLDLRDKYLEVDNPFNVPSPSAVTPQVIITQGSPANEAKPSTVPQNNAENKEVPEKVQESRGVPEAVMETHAEIRRDEVVHTQSPEAVSRNSRPQRNQNPSQDINLITVSGIMNWADKSIKELGHQKTETILEIAEMMGLLSPDLNRIMTKFISIDRDGNSDAVSARDYLDYLLKITTLLGKNNQTEEALLAILPRKGGRG
jgi:archaellum component FlaD/FlaE